MQDARYEREADALIQDRLARLRGLTFGQAATLPEAADEDMVLGGRECTLTTFAQRLGPEQVLVTVLVARPAFFGLASVHRERGLVFSPDGLVREATSDELTASGG